MFEGQVEMFDYFFFILMTFTIIDQQKEYIFCL